MERHLPEVLDSLQQIPEKSPYTRLFLTERRHIRSEIDRYLDAKVVIRSLKLSSGDVTGYSRMRLGNNRRRDAMDGGLEDEIVKSFGENIPET